MKGATATNFRADSLRFDLRRSRTQVLTHAVLKEIGPYLREGHRTERDVYEARLKLFYEQGVEIITDVDRAGLGLPPRGPDGWTGEEIVALEQRRLEILTAPIVMQINKAKD